MARPQRDAPSPPTASTTTTSTPPGAADAGRWPFLVVLAVAAAVTLPFLGAVGFFDPWETHYGEVARQMAVRDDYLYPFWKNAYFYSKPVLLFWLTAPLYKLIGADDPNGPMPASAELVGRLPSALSAILCVAVVYFAARRLWSTRAAVLAGIALATMPLWAFLSRQAITDMLYVSTGSAALLLLAVALFDDDGEASRGLPLPRWLVGIAALCTLPQLWEVARSGAFLNRVLVGGSEAVTRVLVGVALCLVALSFLSWLWTRAKDPLLYAASILFALSTLAKGPVSVVVLGGILLITVAILFEGRRLLRPAVVGCTALFLLIVAPWVIVMLLFSGLDEGRKTWFQRFVLYDLLGRVGGGAHGDRGTFDYYIRYAAFGMFPWTALVPPSLFAAARAWSAERKDRTAADRFTLLCGVWFVVVFVFFSLTTTKFHHYIFPLCVPAALLIGRFLDDLLRVGTAAADGAKAAVLSPLLSLSVVGVAFLVARDLVTEPWQLVDLFTYHYKSYKTDYYFPADKEWRVGMSIAGFGAAVVVTAGAAFTLFRQRVALGLPGRLVLGEAPSKPDDAEDARPFVAAVVVAGLLFSLYAVHVYFNRVSQHWSQRWIHETYQAERKGDEPLVAFQMDWKGETFYAKNQDIQVKKSASDLKKVLERPGRAFVVVHTDRFGAMKTGLGKAYEPHLQVIDRSNKKWFLVVIDDVAGAAAAPRYREPDDVAPSDGEESSGGTAP